MPMITDTPKVSRLPWLIALGIAVTAHAGLFWAYGEWPSQQEPSSPVTTLAVNIQGSASEQPAQTASQAEQQSPLESTQAPATVTPQRQPEQPAHAALQAKPSQPKSTTPRPIHPKPPQPSPASQAVANRQPATAAAPEAVSTTEAVSKTEAGIEPKAAPALTPTTAEAVQNLSPRSSTQITRAEAKATTQPASPSPDATLALAQPPAAPVDLNQLNQLNLSDGMRNYFAEVRDALNRAKLYPLMSKRLAEEDSILLELQLNRRGELVDYRLLEGSRYPRLNTAVETMLSRATPLPAPPREVPDASLRLRYRIEFRLHRP